MFELDGGRSFIDLLTAGTGPLKKCFGDVAFDYYGAWWERFLEGAEGGGEEAEAEGR